MRLGPVLVLAAGLIGIVAFFQPLVTVESPRLTTSLSSLDVVRGIDLARQVRDRIDPDQVDDAKARLVYDNFDEAVAAVRVALVVLYLPTVMLTLIGLSGVARGRLGRVGGGFALAFGMIGAGIAALVLVALSNQRVENVGGASGVAVYLMLAVGGGGFVGGLVTLLSHDRGRAPR